MSKATNFVKDDFTSPSGSKTKVKHILKIDPDGTRRLVEDGIIDVYEQIQSFKESCNIESIIKRVSNGEIDLLNINPGIYTDVAAIPEDLISSYKAFDRASDYYRNLPADVRGKFGSFEAFLESFAYGAVVTAKTDVGGNNDEQIEK